MITRLNTHVDDKILVMYCKLVNLTEDNQSKKGQSEIEEYVRFVAREATQKPSPQDK